LSSNLDRKYSDYEATIVYLKVPLKSINTYKRLVWDYRNADFETCNDCISSLNCSYSELSQTLSFSLIVTSFWGTQFLIISINVFVNPTRTCNTRQSFLDPVLVSDNYNVLESYVIQVDRKYSDHEATIVYLIFNYFNKCFCKCLTVFLHTIFWRYN
jgi:hypothetical protein